MTARKITFPDKLVSKFEEGGRLFVELILDEYEKEDIQLSAHGNYFEIFAYHAGKKPKLAKSDVLKGSARRTLRKRIKVPAYAMMSQARANFQNGRLTIEMPLKGTSFTGVKA